MKYAILLAAGAALSLGACQESGEPAADPTASDAAATPAATAAAPAATGAAAAFTAGQPPSKEFMAGTWGEGDACDQPINFQADGTIKDGPFASWRIDGGMLIMSDPDLGDGPKLKLTVTDKDTMAAQLDGEGEVKTLKRCG